MTKYFQNLSGLAFYVLKFLEEIYTDY